MKLYEFLEMLDFSAEAEILLRDNKGHEHAFCIGYAPEIQEHLELSFSTELYKVIQIGRKDNNIVIVVIEE